MGATKAKTEAETPETETASYPRVQKRQQTTGSRLAAATFYLGRYSLCENRWLFRGNGKPSGRLEYVSNRVALVLEVCWIFILAPKVFSLV
jgi:hypothetical protein